MILTWIFISLSQWKNYTSFDWKFTILNPVQFNFEYLKIPIKYKENDISANSIRSLNIPQNLTSEIPF